MRSSSPLVPCPVCPCGRILTPADAEFAEFTGCCPLCHILDAERAAGWEYDPEPVEVQDAA